jgi:hypothetical protein
MDLSSILPTAILVLTLPLLVAGVLGTDDTKYAVPSDDLAVFAPFL